jgi:ATP-dependent DNA ligase
MTLREIPLCGSKTITSRTVLQRSGRPAGLIEPCLPSPAKAPPSGPDWLHEIKHDSFRILARRDAKGVRLITRDGHDFSKRFLLVVAAVSRCPTGIQRASILSRSGRLPL